MPYLVSSPLPDPWTGKITAEVFNKLRQDLFKIHDHSGTGFGGTISHANIEDSALLGTALTHALLDDHVRGSIAHSDNPGGDQGVHGLSPSQHVAGSQPRQFVVQIGTGTVNRWDKERNEHRGRGTFGTPFKETPTVFCVNTFGESAVTTVYQTLLTSFAVRFRFYYTSDYFQKGPDGEDGDQWAVTFCFIALGVI
jgi:hypothetical protein